MPSWRPLAQTPSKTCSSVAITSCQVPVYVPASTRTSLLHTMEPCCLANSTTATPTSSTITTATTGTGDAATGSYQEGGEEIEQEVKNYYSNTWLKRFWKWFNQDGSEKDHVQSPEEIAVREELLRRVQEMYFAKPPVSPELGFYKEVFTVLVKYNDDLGVETLWSLMSEMQVEPDEELTALVKPFLAKARRNAWFN